MKKFMTWVLMPLILFFSIHMELQAEENTVLIWNQTTLNLIQNTNVPPTIAARTLAIVHTSIYDAWAAFNQQAAGTRRGITLRRPLSEQTLANQEQAISFAAFRVLLDLFPSQAQSLTDIMNLLGYDPSYITQETITPAGIGNLVAAEILSFRHFDGSNQLGNEVGSPGTPYSDYTGYQPVNSSTQIVDPSRWQPLNVAGSDQKFLTPQWGFVIPFALTTPDQFFPKVQPATYPSKRYKQQAEDILQLSAALNDKKKSIAVYWADGPGTVTPPGHWNEFAQFISSRDHHRLDDDVKMFFILNNALLDCSISVWYIKRLYDSERPITAIHFLFNGKNVEAWGGPGQGTQIIQGQTWQPYLSPTPPFAEFVSGHSTFSSASAEVLSLFTGSDKFGLSAVVPQGSSFVEPGIVPATDITLFWETFTDAANQAGRSRRLGGIHFKDGDFQGRKLGRKIGAQAFEIAQRYIEGLSSNNDQ